MLILTRRIGEKLMIGDDIDVIVLDITSTQVKLGIKAPRSTSILREELFRADKKLLESELLAEQEALENHCEQPEQRDYKERQLETEQAAATEPHDEPAIEAELETGAHANASLSFESQLHMALDASPEQTQQKTNTIIKTRKKRAYSISDDTEAVPQSPSENAEVI